MMPAIRVRLVVAWTLSLLLFFQLLPSGLAKLAAGPEATAPFISWGYGPGATRAIGALQTIGAMLVLSPTWAFWGAAMLLLLTLGAVFAHLSAGGGDPGFAVTLALFCAALLFLRYDDARFLAARTDANSEPRR